MHRLRGKPNESLILRHKLELATYSITRARMTQIMVPLCLAPEVQLHTLALLDMVHRTAITERALRPIAQLDTHEDQNDTHSLFVCTSRAKQ